MLRRARSCASPASAPEVSSPVSVGEKEADEGVAVVKGEAVRKPEVVGYGAEEGGRVAEVEEEGEW